MAVIQIWTRDVSGVPQAGSYTPQHTFFIKLNDDGTREILRGGPIYDNMIEDDINIIRQDYNGPKQADLTTNTYDWYDPLTMPNDLNYQGGVAYIGSQAEVDAKWEAAWTAAQTMNSNLYDYEPLTQNCNTSTSLMADAMGLRDRLDEFMEATGRWTPGYGNNFNDSVWDKTYDWTKELPDVASDQIRDWYNDFKDAYDYASAEAQQRFENAYNTALNSFFDTTNSIKNSITSAYERFKAAISLGLTDPLIIDMGDDGLQLKSWEQSGVMFDLNANGTIEQSGWTTANGNDVFLAIDKNSNGNIDDISELFGNATTPGFKELKNFDSNNDNVIDANDSQFGLLKIWNDANANGVVDTGEMTTLAENNVTSISLKYISSPQSLAGNLRLSYADVNFADGSVRTIHEVAFGKDEFNSVIVDPDQALGEGFQLDIATIFLPYSRGYGALNSWQVAMTLDGTLLDMAEEMVAATPENIKLLPEQFKAFLFRWADVENVTVADVYENGTSGGNVDIRIPAFLEKFTGLDVARQNAASAVAIMSSWDMVFNELFTRFVVQGPFADIFPDARYDFATDELEFNASLDDIIANIEAKAVEMTESSFLNYAYNTKTILGLSRDQFNDPDFDNKLDSMVSNLAHAVSISGFDFDGIFNIGTSDENILFGSGSNDVLKGQDGDDDIIAVNGNDYIEGGRGDDYLKGEAGNDIYVFNKGDGQDTIEDISGTDRIVLGGDISASDISFATIGNDLIINIGATDKIGIKNFYLSTTNRVEALELADGSKLDLTNLGLVVNGSSSNETLNGGTKDDIINGFGGNDTISANSGNDLITGGAGNDIIDGGTGDDTYFFNVGDGQDVIEDYSGVDKVVFGAGITQSDITLIPNVASADSLIVKVGESGDQITLKYFFYNWGNGRKIETLQFADGSIIDLSNGVNLEGTNVAGETLYGTQFNDLLQCNVGNDTIYSGSGNDIITGSAGNDYMDGGDGDDTYFFNVGDGQDVIEDSSGVDKVVFGAGITQSDITLIPNVASADSLIVKVGESGDQITLKYFFYNWGNGRKIETLQFADGSIIDLSNGVNLEGTNVVGETLYGTQFNDLLQGNVGNDTISSGSGDDIITGSAGNDYMDGGDGDDKYFFNVGDGQDVIEDYSGVDKVVFGAGITQSDITLIPDVVNNYSLIVKIGENGDQITLKYFFYNWDNGRKIETLGFADGSIIDISGALTVVGTNPDGETLYGTLNSDIIIGADGNDTISSGSGNDIITGSAGNDYMDGGDGDDTYFFNVGDGQDIIEDSSGVDKVVFGAGITQSDITLIPNVASADSLIVKVGESGDQITLKYFFYNWGNGRKIETLQFADGSIIDLSNGVNLEGTNVVGETLYGTQFNDLLQGNVGNDTISSGSGNDIITGSAGNDYMDGGDGDDTYFFNAGDGQDVITDDSGVDKIVFGAGITANDITLIPDVVNNYSLIVKIGENGDQITLKYFFYNWDNGRKIETLGFADGSIIDISGALTVVGTNPDGETLYGTLNSDIIIGADGNDTISSGSGNDIITGSAGNDIIDGSSGNDTYIFNIGDGQDTIYDTSGADKIVFGSGIAQSDIIMEANGNDLVFTVGVNGDKITNQNFFSSTSYRIEQIEFEDGSVFNIANGLTASGGANDDYIIGTPFNDTLSGGAGNDYIYGAGGDDNLNGNAGDDILRGGSGNDKYNFDSGFGNDVIREESGTADLIAFGSGIISSSIALIRSNSDLVISQIGSNDTITIENFFSSNNNRVENITFADGSNFSLANVLSADGSNFAYSVNGYGRVYEDVATTIKLLNINGQAQSYSNISIITGAANGVAAINNGQIVYTGNLNYNGADSFVIQYNDSVGAQQTKIINIDVLPVNDAPTGENVNSSTDEDVAVEISPLVVASDIDGDVLAINSVVDPDHGEVQIIGDKIIYTPDNNFFGSDTFNYTITDNNGGEVTKSITVNVASVNDIPVANDDAVVTDEDQAFVIPVTANDDDVEDGFFPGSQIIITVNPLHGTVETTENGGIHYIPEEDFFGEDSFKYTITDSNGAVSNEAMATITVNQVNDAPKIKLNSQLVVNEDHEHIFNVSDYFYDPEGDSFIVTDASAENGTVNILTGQLSYISNTDFNGLETITVTLEDINGESRTVNLGALVNPVNDAPVAVNDNVILQEDVDLRINILANDIDIDDVLFANSISDISDPAHGTIQIDMNDGSVIYTPDSNYNGLDSFTYTITDSGGLSSSATVSLQINASNDAPTSSDTSLIVAEDDSVVRSLAEILADSGASDVDGDILVLSAFGTAGHGTVEASGDGFIYTPDTDFNGSDSFDFTLSDGNGGEVTRTYNITVTPVNDAPIVGSTISTQFANAGGNFIYTISSGSFTDADGDELTYTATLSDGSNLPSWLSFDGITRTFSGVVPALSGVLSIVVKASDGESFATQEFSLQIEEPVALEGSLRGDVIYGSEGYDVIKGRGGNDILHGLGGDDNIYGGLGNDKLIGGSGSDHLDGGKGTDGAKYEGSDAGVKIDLGLGEVSGGYAEGDVLVNIENIFGSEHADILTGDEKANKIFGNDGDDVISGGSGRDVIRGDGGDDIITGGFGNDVLTGGAGADLFVYENVGDSVDGSSDLIKGFNVNDDAIDLVALATFGIDSFDDLVITQDSASGRTIIGVNVDNVDVAAHDFEIALKGLINIDQDNFHFG